MHRLNIISNYLSSEEESVKRNWKLHQIKIVVMKALILFVSVGTVFEKSGKLEWWKCQEKYKDIFPMSLKSVFREVQALNLPPKWTPPLKRSLHFLDIVRPAVLNKTSELITKVPGYVFFPVWLKCIFSILGEIPVCSLNKTFHCVWPEWGKNF